MPLNSKITTTNRPVTANGKHRFHKVTQPLPPDYPRQARAATLRQLSTWKSALRRLDVIIAAYQAFLDKVRGRDDVSFALVVGLLGAQTHRRADIVAALAGQ